MLKTHWRFISLLQRVGDNLLLILAFYFSYSLRAILFGSSNLSLQLTNYKFLAPIDRYYVLLGIALPVFNAILSLCGAYTSMRFSSLTRLLKVTYVPAIIVFLCTGSLLFILKLDLSRSFVGLYCFVGASFLFLERWLVLISLRFFRVRGKNFRNVLIVGTGKQARQVFQEINKFPELGVRVVGFVQVLKGKSEIFDLQSRIVANEDSFESALKKYAIDEVLFSEVGSSFETFKELAKIAIEEGVQVSLAADLFSLDIFRSDITNFGTVPLIQFHPSKGGSDHTGLFFKRLIDLSAATLLLIFFLPFFVLIAVLIKLDSRGSVFFYQKRVGKNGRIFTLLKFRSMIEGAEQMRSELEDLNEMSGPVFKISNDPRVTKIGKILRKYSLDELPQLFNILKGDMSLVGPRPPLPQEVEMYERKQRRRLSMRPGLTCTWQVSGRNDIPDFESWAELDLEYVDNWSLLNDFKLLLKTIPAVLSASGAK